MTAAHDRAPVLPLARDEIHVWHGRASAGLAVAGRLLGDDELARGARFRRAADRERWIGARAVLRDLLARYGIAQPGETLRVGAYGKPAAANAKAPRFNHSHAGDDVLVAIAWEEVGVDIEGPPPGDVLALGRAALGEPVAARLARLPSSARTGEFLRLWTRHEARVKAAGTGLGGPPPPAKIAAKTIEVDTRGAAAVAAVGDPRIRLRAWQV